MSTTHEEQIDPILCIGKYKIPLDPYEEYKLFDEDVNIEELLEIDFEYLPDTYKLVLVNIFRRTNEISIQFHPDVVRSIMEEKDASSYYNKTPYEIESILRKESTKSDTEVKEEKKMLADVDTTSQVIRNRKYYTLQMMVKAGYDRAYVMDFLEQYLVENGNGVLNLTPKRISEKLEEAIQKQKNKEKFTPKTFRQSAK